MQIPQPGVPQIMTMEGRYVRAAYNNEGYAILGYKLANLSVGEPWMLLEVGFALRDGMPDYDLTRDAVSLETPDGKTIPLPSIAEFRKGDVRALQAREKVQRDSINYFPPNASPGVLDPVLHRRGQSGDGLGQGRAHQPARVPRPALLPGAGRDHVRPALAEREVREERRAGALPDPDRRKRTSSWRRTTGTSRSRSRRPSRRRARGRGSWAAIGRGRSWASHSCSALLAGVLAPRAAAQGTARAGSPSRPSTGSSRWWTSPSTGSPWCRTRASAWPGSSTRR